MASGRFIGLLIAVIVIITTVVLLRSTKDLYKLLPANLEPEMAVSPFEDWRTFTSTTGNFTAQFPAPPQHAAENSKESSTNDKRKYDMYVAQKNDGSTFMISLITYENKNFFHSPDTVLTNVLEEMMISNPKNRLEKSDLGDFKGYRAIDFSIENPEGRITGKAFIVGQTLYLITYIAKLDDYKENEYRYFLDSFQFLTPRL